LLDDELLDELLFDPIVPPTPPEPAEPPPMPPWPPTPVVTTPPTPEDAAVSVSPEHPGAAIAVTANTQQAERIGVFFMATLHVIIVAVVFRDLLHWPDKRSRSRSREIFAPIKIGLHPQVSW
jgi:hypothetical protein